MSDINTKEFRNTLGCFTTGVCIVTTSIGKTPLGMTINSFASVSLDPPLVLWGLDNKSVSYDVFANTDFYNIHILTSDQQDLSNKFASKDEDKFADVDWQFDKRSVPFIEGCKSSFRCSAKSSYKEGDHLVLVGRVLELNTDSGEKPLIFAQGNYTGLK